MITADEHASLYDVSKLMRQHHIGDVVITRLEKDGPVPVGVLTDRDIVVHGIACDIDLNEVAAGDLSGRNLVTVERDSDVFEIVQTMNAHAVRRVIVKSESSYDGIVTFDDILWALAQILSNLGVVAERQIQQETKGEIAAV